MRSLRVEFVDVLRAVVHSERCASDSLCRDDEKESLLWAALTPEMAELANNGPINEEFIKLPALKELWQLYFLLRSEFIRLLFMTLLESSIMGTFSLFSRWYGQAREMISYSKKLNAVSRFIGQQKFSNDPENKKRILPTMEPFDRARVQLQIASDLLSSKKADSDVSDVVRILSEVIKALNSGSQDTQPDMVQQVDGVSVGHESFMRENDDREFAVAAASNVPSAANVDQMFEAVSHPDVTPLSYSSSFFDSVSKEVTETARSLVNELESALEDRKREMKKRERIALARFYGNPHEFEDTSDPRFANATDSDDSEPISRSTVSSIHNSEDTEASTHKQSSQKSSNSDEGNLSENPEAKRNSIPHRYTASAWGTGLSDALRIRSALPQQHFGDTDSADSEHDTVSTQE
ncbi:unnamed protein product [Toxocara canis]|uniref:Rab-GAP TBC domain-containing protein n=1 Tax=Toxocara canis TaxID=6265 RepID=A0A183UQD7_TOXCA|nr:unnamed protein product [Toxocara canis]